MCVCRSADLRFRLAAAAFSGSVATSSGHFIRATDELPHGGRQTTRGPGDAADFVTADFSLLPGQQERVALADDFEVAEFPNAAAVAFTAKRGSPSISCQLSG